MTDTRKWAGAAVVLVVAIFLATWFLLVSPKRGDAAELRSQTASQDNANALLTLKIQQLQEQQKDLPKQQARLATLRGQIPSNPALPTLIRSLTSAGAATGVDIDAMAPAPPSLLTLPGAGVVAAPAPSSDSTDTAAPAAPAPAASTTPTLWQVPLNLTVTGSYFELEQFLNKLEDQKRALLVSGFTIAPAGSEDATAGDLSVTLNARVFLSQAAAPTTATAAPVASE